MSRKARLVLPGIPHHVTQRGNRQANIFLNPPDRDVYVSVMCEAAAKFGVRFRAYCLMTNHVHFIAIPEETFSLAKAFHRAHTIYSGWFNETYQCSGHLFQGRAHSSPLDETHYWTAMRYVERNPVKAGLVDCAQDYPWSSAAAHCGLRSDRLLEPASMYSLNHSQWSQWISDAGSEEEYQRIRERTRIGLPCGNEEFIRRIEVELGRSLSPRRRGRKPR